MRQAPGRWQDPNHADLYQRSPGVLLCSQHQARAGTDLILTRPVSQHRRHPLLQTRKLKERRLLYSQALTQLVSDKARLELGNWARGSLTVTLYWVSR